MIKKLFEVLKGIKQQVDGNSNKKMKLKIISEEVKCIRVGLSNDDTFLLVIGTFFFVIT